MKKTRRMLDIESEHNKPLEEILRELHVGLGYPCSRVGRTLGVSIDAARKWLKQFGLYVKKEKKEPPPKEVLEDLYLQQGLSTTKIGKMYDTCASEISRLLRKNEIPIRSRADGVRAALALQPPSKEELETLYYDENLSQVAIAERYNVTPNTIGNWFRRMGIQARGNAEAQLLRIGASAAGKEELEELYLNKQYTTKEIGEIYGVTGNAVCNWLRKHEIPVRSTAEAAFLSANRGKNIITKEELEGLYVDERLSIASIAARYDVSETKIKNLMGIHGIETRSLSEAYRARVRRELDEGGLSFERGLEAYLRCSEIMDDPVGIEEFFRDYDPETLQPSEERPLRAYLRII